MSTTPVQELAPTGQLRVALNMSNFLLVNGRTAAGDPDGVSPDIARAIGAELGVPVSFVPFKGPGDVADAVDDGSWDIANIANEAKRAKTIHFSPAYCEIEATYLVPPNSPLTSIDNVDVPGIRIAVKARSAYDLWLEAHLEHATLVRAPSIDESFAVFVRDALEVLAGLRPKLLEQQLQLPGSTVLPGQFTAVRQSIGCHPKHTVGAAFLADFVQRAVDGGLVATLLEKHGVSGKLGIPHRPSRGDCG